MVKEPNKGMKKQDLVEGFIRSGMIQFGYFAAAYDQPAAPIAFHFSLLPSFPHLMEETAELFREIIGTPAADTRLLADQNTVGLGAVLAVKTDIPLLYPHGSALQFTNAFTIEGTADVDNPIILISDVLSDGTAQEHMHHMSKKIGLPVKHTLAVLDTSSTTLGFPNKALLRLSDVVQWSIENSEISKTMAARIMAWHQRKD